MKDHLTPDLLPQPWSIECWLSYHDKYWHNLFYDGVQIGEVYQEGGEFSLRIHNSLFLFDAFKMCQLATILSTVQVRMDEERKGNVLPVPPDPDALI